MNARTNIFAASDDDGPRLWNFSLPVCTYVSCALGYSDASLKYIVCVCVASIVDLMVSGNLTLY